MVKTMILTDEKWRKNEISMSVTVIVIASRLSLSMIVKNCERNLKKVPSSSLASVRQWQIAMLGELLSPDVAREHSLG